MSCMSVARPAWYFGPASPLKFAFAAGMSDAMTYRIVASRAVLNTVT